jgi:hypothetical protein
MLVRVTLRRGKERAVVVVRVLGRGEGEGVWDGGRDGGNPWRLTVWSVIIDVERMTKWASKGVTKGVAKGVTGGFFREDERTSDDGWAFAGAVWVGRRVVSRRGGRFAKSVGSSEAIVEVGGRDGETVLRRMRIDRLLRFDGVGKVLDLQLIFLDCLS